MPKVSIFARGHQNVYKEIESKVSILAHIAMKIAKMSPKLHTSIHCSSDTKNLDLCAVTHYNELFDKIDKAPSL